jgi:hypothetical protein
METAVSMPAITRETTSGSITTTRMGMEDMEPMGAAGGAAGIEASMVIGVASTVVGEVAVAVFMAAGFTAAVSTAVALGADMVVGDIGSGECPATG